MAGQVSRTTPSVIIGMGGSGDWVLRQVKEALQRSHGGRVPSATQLIGIDTAAILPANARAGGQQQFVAPELSPGERVRLNGNIQALTGQVAQYRVAAEASRARSGGAASVPDPDNVANLASWFVAEYYLPRLPPAAYDLSMGASQLRQFGRMAVVLDVRNQGSPLMASIRHAIQEAERSTTRQDQSLEIILVASVAGGTGAGMFIDIAHLVRREAKRSNPQRTAIVRAFLFTPRVFRSIPGGDSPEMRARAFAAMREANRFYRGFDKRYGYPMAYSAADTQPGGIVDEAIFDHLYYIDGNSRANSLDGQAPDQAHFPMVADAILSIVDDARAGEAFGQHSANVRGALARIPNVPVCSAVSAYTYILPVELWRRQFGLMLLTDALDKLFPIRQGPGGGAEPLLPEATIAGQQNETGDAGADRFMRQGTFGEEDAQVAASGFTAQMFTMLEGYVPGNALSVRQIGQQGLDRFRTAFTPVEASDTAQQLRTVRAQLDLNLTEHIETGRGHVLPRTIGNNLQGDVPRLIQQHVGRDQDGQRVGGTFRAALDKYREHHRSRFRETMTLHVDALLNPPAGGEDEVAVRRGRLGYVQDFCLSMTRQFDQYDNLMEALLPDKANAERDADQRQRVARQVMVDSAEYVRRIPLGWLVLIALLLSSALGSVLYFGGQFAILWSIIAGTVFGVIVAISLSFIKGAQYSSQDEFIDASQEYVDAVQENLLLQAMRATARNMREDVVALKGSVDKWAEVLRTGRTPSSVYRELDGSLQAVKADRIKLEESKVRTYVRDQTYEEELYNRATEYDSQTRRRGAVTELATSFRWPKLVWDSGTLPLRSLLLETPGSADGVARTASFDLPQDREFDRAPLVKALCDRADAYFRTLGESISIINYLRTRHQATAFATTLWEQIGQGVKLTLTGAQELPQRSHYNFLRIAHGQEAAEVLWLREVGDVLSANIPGATAATVQSADTHSCSLVFTDDIIQLETEVAEWRENLRNYVEYAGSRVANADMGSDRRILHCFASEIWATAYERAIQGALQQVERTFDDRVTRLLENPDQLRLFLRARAAGVIFPFFDGTAHKYVLAQDSEYAGQFIHLTLDATDSASLYAAMSQFVKGREDVRAGAGMIRPIDGGLVEARIVSILEASAGEGGKSEEVTRLEAMHARIESYLANELGLEVTAIREHRVLGQAPEQNPVRLAGDVEAITRIMLQEERRSLTQRIAQHQLSQTQRGQP